MKLLRMIFSKRGQTNTLRPESESRAYWERMRPLGDLRCRILVCMSADNPKVPAYFNPSTTVRLQDALYDHLKELFTQFSSDASARLILAAGLMTFGRLDMAEAIIRALPAAQVVTDHGAGWCRLLPYRVAADLLPLPEELRDPVRWIEGKPQAEALRAWLVQNRDHLWWDPEAERFIEARA